MIDNIELLLKTMVDNQYNFIEFRKYVTADTEDLKM
jgi:hypothetical protein